MSCGAALPSTLVTTLAEGAGLATSALLEGVSPTLAIAGVALGVALDATWPNVDDDDGTSRAAAGP
jgi:hypothetical protein